VLTKFQLHKFELLTVVEKFQVIGKVRTLVVTLVIPTRSINRLYINIHIEIIKQSIQQQKT
jgi:hypothetical protein